MKKEKIRFCKYCGGQIDMNQKQCTSCGKKFFKASRIISLRVLCIVELVAILLLTYTSIYWYYFYRINYRNAKEYYEIIKTQSQEIETLELKNSEYIKADKILIDEYDKLQIEYEKTVIDSIGLDAYQEDFAYYTNTGSKYHKLSCSYLKNSSTLYGDNINSLKAFGYSPCELCY